MSGEIIELMNMAVKSNEGQCIILWGSFSVVNCFFLPFIMHLGGRCDVPPALPLVLKPQNMHTKLGARKARKAVARLFDRFLYINTTLVRPKIPPNPPPSINQSPFLRAAPPWPLPLLLNAGLAIDEGVKGSPFARLARRRCCCWTHPYPQYRWRISTPKTGGHMTTRGSGME